MSKPPAERAGRDDHGDDPDVPMTPEKELYPRRFPRLGSQFQTRISKSTEPSDRPAALLLSVDFPYLTTQDVDKEQQQQQQQQQLSPTSSTPRQDIHNPSLYESMEPASDQLSSNQEQVESNTQGRSKTPLCSRPIHGYPPAATTTTTTVLKYNSTQEKKHVTEKTIKDYNTVIYLLAILSFVSLVGLKDVVVVSGGGYSVCCQLPLSCLMILVEKPCGWDQTNLSFSTIIFL
jgi:hypothetical protein